MSWATRPAVHVTELMDEISDMPSGYS